MDSSLQRVKIHRYIQPGRHHPRRPNAFWQHEEKMRVIRKGNQKNLKLTGSVEVLKGLLDTNRHGLLTLANPVAGIEELLVGLVSALGVTDLGEEVVLVLENEVPDTGEVGVLHVGVDVDLNDTVADGLLELGLGGAGTTVEDEENGLGGLGAELLGDVLLVLGEELGVQLDVTGLVNSVDVTEASGDGIVGCLSSSTCFYVI